METLEKFLDDHPRWRLLSIYIRRIETFASDGGILVANCKELIESIAKTILVDHFEEDIGSNAKFQTLVNQACRKMGVIRNVADLMRSFSSLAVGLGTLRNNNADSGHGRAASELERVPSEITQASADCIVAVSEQISLFLLKVFEHEHPQRESATPLSLNTHLEFNEECDANHDAIELMGYGPYAPSELLFAVDLNAYKAELNLFLSSNNE